MASRSKHDGKIDRLRTLPLFTTTGARELRAIAAAGDLVTVEAGRAICRAERYAREAFLVVDGMVDVVIARGVGGPHETRTTVATLRRGNLVGELGVIDGLPRTADVVAVSDVTVLAIDARAMRSLLATSKTMREAMLRQLADRIRRSDEELVAVRA
ncbi:MAG TPA: cyclic nucleotide-binding domain-containing protein [Acidimicrobiales bacterium]|nr:cyclic nucleotide-binding domain-containing protein [Acidimicrobiales bacterium]